jgi:ribonuclease BN (tRNA processing enzyme)
MKTYIVWVLVLSSILNALVTSPVYAKEQLVATIIGSGSPLYNENRASASVLVALGDTRILVDMGNGAQTNLNKLGVQPRTLSALLFTHHHLDHNEEFVPIFISSLMGRNDFMIFGPPNTRKLTEANLDLYEEDISYRLNKTQRTLTERKKAFEVKDILGGESFKIGKINVSTVKVPHTIHTIAYRFDYDGQSIVITGDLTYAENLPALAKNADFMIIDSGGMVMTGGRNNRPTAKKTNKDGGSKNKGANSQNKRSKRVRAHLDLADSSLLAKQAKIKNLVYTHFTPGEIDQETSLKQIRKNYAGNVIFATDFMVLNPLKLKSSQGSINSSEAVTYKGNHSYPIADTGQKTFYSTHQVISAPAEGEAFFGQDANYIISDPSYTNNHNGTITDNVTGLMWQQDLTEKLTYEQAQEKVKNFYLGGYNDWRIATVKELYSLIQFTGTVMGDKAITPFIDTGFFTQPLGDSSQGEREIDAQVWSSTEYVGKTMKNDDTVFGVNFVDGRIKGYPKYNPRTREANKMYFRFVRDNKDYGKNKFFDNDDGTITDTATGLTWQKADSAQGMNWQDALEYSNNLELGGHDDWRLPNAKELQSIVDYSRSPETSNSAAINPIFQTSYITNEGGEKDYPYYWSSTTHLDGRVPEANAVYIAFGKALGEMRGQTMDVHGAGAQRSDPKTGEAMSRGPQGDMIRVNNYVRSVRGGVVDSQVTTEMEATYSDSESTSRASTSKNVNSETKRAVNKRPLSGSNRFISRLDKDNDGKVSSTEFKGPAKRFTQFDSNNDGYISANEAPTGPPSEKKR